MGSSPWRKAIRNYLLTILFSITPLSLISNVHAAERNLKKGLYFRNAESCNVFDRHTTSSWWYTKKPDDDGFSEGSFCTDPETAVNNARQSGMEFVPSFSFEVPSLPLSVDIVHNLERANHLMTFHKPEFTFHANIFPFEAASVWPQIESIAASYDVKIVAPCISQGIGMDWLSDWDLECNNLYGASCHFDYSCLHLFYQPYPCDPEDHSWACIGEDSQLARKDLGDLYELTGKPVWVAEYACAKWGATSGVCTVAEEMSLMETLTTLFESTDYVYRYSWYAAYHGNDSNVLNEMIWDQKNGVDCTNKRWLSGFGVENPENSIQECVSLAVSSMVDTVEPCHQPLSIGFDGSNCYCAIDSCEALELTWGSMKTYLQVGLLDSNELTSLGEMYNSFQLVDTPSPVSPDPITPAPATAAPANPAPLPAIPAFLEPMLCPPVGQNSTLGLEDETSAQIMLINSLPGNLCTLVLASADGTSLKPVSRSYDGHDWEPYAGDFAFLQYSCSSGTGCTVELPAPEESGSIYVLVSSTHSLSSLNEISRFLEQTTFGPTLQEINSMASSGTSFEQYIQLQQTLPISSHREFFRMRQNHRMETTSYQYTITHPCKKGTRYRAFAFTSKDRDRFLEIRSFSGNKKLLLVDGQVRTVVDGPVQQGSVNNPDANKADFVDGVYQICYEPQEQIGGYFGVDRPGEGCLNHIWFGGVRGNPGVHFGDLSTLINPTIRLVDHVSLFGNEFYEGQTQELYVNSDINDINCRSFPEIFGAPDEVVVGVTEDGAMWLHSPSFLTFDNQVESPLPDGGNEAVLATDDASAEFNRIKCFSAPRTFLNEESCILTDDGCTTIEIDHVEIAIEVETFRKIYDVTGGVDGAETRYVYAITNLRQGELESDVPPCTSGSRSRWVSKLPSDCAGRPVLEDTTENIFSLLIDAASEDDTNPMIRDVFMPIGVACAASDQDRFDFFVRDSRGGCWQNTHPDNFQVYDFTIWTVEHPGNSDMRNPIKEFADIDGSFMLEYPSWHTMQRWVDNRDIFQEVGRLGDMTFYRNLPYTLQRGDVADEFGISFDEAEIVGPFVVCGSPFESGNDLSLSGGIGRGGFDARTKYNRTSPDYEFDRQKSTVWMEIALGGEDQLRQRIAWCLYQIISLSTAAIANSHHTESFLTYYDIFVRNAFGSYRDVLKEIAYSPLMAEMLSYNNGISTGYQWTQFNKLEYADENFAREIMQLFSIGLYGLNEDGTPIYSGSTPSLTYTNSDITEYARAWTGFRRQPLRGNVEDPSSERVWANNEIDPMRIEIDHRDYFPKLGLLGQYIGDGYPLCSDFPEQHFLKQGAAFRLLGGSGKPTLAEDFDWKGEDIVRFSLDFDNSQLAAKICNKSNPSSGGPCNFALHFVLDEDISCFGLECDLDSLSTFEVAPGIFYEYVKPACVHHAFYNDGISIKKKSGGEWMCAERSSLVAGAMCCPASSSASPSSREGVERYSGERVSFETAVARCEGIQESICENPKFYDAFTEDLAYAEHFYYWSLLPCNLKIKINQEGMVAIVHKPNLDETVNKMVAESTKMFFRVIWSDDALINELIEDYGSKCVERGCVISSIDGYCVCEVTSVSERAVFPSESAIGNASVEEILSLATIGALPPRTAGESISEKVKIHNLGSFGVDSILEVVDGNNVVHYRKNIVSTVLAGGMSFRNPVQFISVQDPQPFEAHYETDATIDHYFYHPNTAPFLAIRFAQRFGISNPSPRYVKTISTAFRSGQHISGDGTEFGSGRYGDLGAAFAAVILDREARSIVLDADPMHGSLLEPFMKIVRVMRSLNFEPADDHPVVQFRISIQDQIGQEPHALPGVFSFFRPEYQPAGRIGRAGFVSPESQVLTGPNAVNMMNIILSYIKYGMNTCYDGFGFGSWTCEIGNTPDASGASSYAPAVGATVDEVVEELSMLLTSGRLSEENKALVSSVYQNTTNIHGKTPFEAMVNAQQLIVLSPEFHSSGLVRPTGKKFEESTVPSKSDKPYKAVVKILLKGGCDSYNMLVPEVCSGTNAAGVGVREQYDTERGVMRFLAGTETSLRISVDVRSSAQPCEEFVVHDELRIVKELYDSNELMFFANTGVIDSAGYTKQNYQDLTDTQLFAHNAMQDETQKVDPFDESPGTGVLGRAADILESIGFNVAGMSIDSPFIAVNGAPDGEAPRPLTISRFGATTFNDNRHWEEKLYFNTTDYAYQLNGEPGVQSNIFGENWSNQFTAGISSGNRLKKALDGVPLSQDIWFQDGTTGNYYDNRLASGDIQDEYWLKFSTLFKLLASHDSRGTDREVFYAEFDGWDHHSQMKTNLRKRFNGLNFGLSLFVEELKRSGLWDDVTIVVTSDFGRTLTPNSGDGSDHAWGGHYMMMGGSVDGGKILGEYPHDLTLDGPLNIGRGRIIPTTSWDAIWSGVLEWMGIPVNHENSGDAGDMLDEILPNGRNVGDLFTKDDLYRNDGGGV